MEALAEDAVKMRRSPGDASRGPEHDRRWAWILGTALDVWQVIEAYEDMGERGCWKKVSFRRGR